MRRSTTGTLRLTAGEASSMAAMIKAAYQTGTPQVLTDRARRHLQAELGGVEQMIRWLVALVATGDRPIGFNVANAEGSRTFFIPPVGWTQERLAGHVATMGGVLEDEFGAVARPATDGDGAES